MVFFFSIDSPTLRLTSGSFLHACPASWTLGLLTLDKEGSLIVAVCMRAQTDLVTSFILTTLHGPRWLVSKTLQHNSE